MFLTSLRTEKIGPQRWLLIDDLVYRTELFRGTFVVTRGFQTDFASIPRIFWSIFPPVDSYDAAAVLHDAAYADSLMSNDKRVHLVKGFADDLFYEAMLDLHVNKIKARIMYLGVNLFGNPSNHPLMMNQLKGNEIDYRF